MPQVPSMLTTKDVADRLNVSEDTALRILAREPGVLRIKNRSRTIYRVTEQWFTTFIARKSKSSNH
jgi:hypothetical protein